MRCNMLKWYLVLLLVGLACIPLVSAVSIEISPHQVAPGDLITVTTTGLKDGSNVTMKMVVVDKNPGPGYKMEISDLNFPINLDSSTFEITNDNTDTNTVYIANFVSMVGWTYLTLGGKSVDNHWSHYLNQIGRDDINGTFYLIRIAGNTKVGGASEVISAMEWNGIKRADTHTQRGQVNGGPEDFTFSFKQSGIQSGSFELTIHVNGTMVASDKVIIGNPVSAQYTSSSLTGIVKNNQPYIIPSFIQGITPGHLPVQSQMKGQNAIPSFVPDSGAGNTGVFSQFLVSTTAINNGKYVKLI